MLTPALSALIEEEAPPLPLGGGDLMIGRKQVLKRGNRNYINVRLHQIGIRGRIGTYLAKGYNSVIVIRGNLKKCLSRVCAESGQSVVE